MRTIAILVVMSVLAIIGLTSMMETAVPKNGSTKVAAPAGPRISVQRERVRFNLSNANYRRVTAPQRRNVVTPDPFLQKKKSRGGPFELRVPEGTKLKTPKRVDKNEEKKGGKGESKAGAK